MPKTDSGPIGLSATSEALAAAQVIRGSGGKSSLRLWSVPAPSDLFSEGVIADNTALQSALRRLTAGSGIKLGRVVAAVPEPSYITQLTKLPAMPASEMKETVRGIAEQYAIFGDDEIAADYAPVGESVEGGVNKQSILLASARKCMISAWEEALAAMGAFLENAEPAVLSILRALYPELSGPEPVAAVVIGRDCTHVNIFQDGMLGVSYTISTGISANRFQAGRAVVDYSSEEETRPSETEFSPALISEIKNTLRFFQVQCAPSRCTRILLLAEPHIAAGISPIIERELDVVVDIFDVRHRWEFDDNSLRALDSLGAVQAVTAIGLALSEDAGGFPLRIRLSERQGAYQPSLRVPLIAASAAALVVLAGACAYSFSVNARIRTLDSRADAFKPQIAEVRSRVEVLEQEQKTARDLQMAIESQFGRVRSQNRVLWSQIIRQVSNGIPSGIWLTEVKTKEHGIRLEGYALREQSVADYLQDLGQSPYLNSVSLRSVERDVSPSGARVFRFLIVGRITGGSRQSL